MESYNVGSIAATQGRYANIAGMTQPAAVSPEQDRKDINAKQALADKAIQTVAEVEAAQEDRAVVDAQEEQKAKYDEITQDGEKMNAITEILNEFMAQFNANLRFSLHKDTSMFTVKFVDIKNNKVLKEFPPEEYLDLIAKIRKYIGTMIDTKV